MFLNVFIVVINSIFRHDSRIYFEIIISSTCVVSNRNSKDKELA